MRSSLIWCRRIRLRACRVSRIAVTAEVYRQFETAPSGGGLKPANVKRGFIAVKALGPVPAKGLGDPVAVYEATVAGPASTRLLAAAVRLTRFVGRRSSRAAVTVRWRGVM